MAKILNFGSLNIDQVYKLDHFPRPGETISSIEAGIFCGGKGLNQSIAMSRAGAKAAHAGCVGSSDGHMLLDVLKKEKVDTRHVRMLDMQSGIAVIQIDASGQNSIILHGGANRQISAAHIEEVLSCYGRGDMILLQNEINDVKRIIHQAYEKGMYIVLNPAPYSSDLSSSLDKVSLLILNEVEGSDITGCDREDSIRILEMLKKELPHASIALTLGKNGAIYYDGKTEYRHGIYEVDVVDTTAAGDTFVGYMLACINSGMDPESVIKTASKAASLAVTKKGASPSIPYIDQVQSMKNQYIDFM